MFCENCGSPIETGEAFCANCGAPTAGEAPSFTPQFDPDPEVLKEENNTESKPPKKKNKKVLIGVIAGIVVVLIGAFVAIGFATGLFSGGKAEPSTMAEYEKASLNKMLSTYRNALSDADFLDGGSYTIEVEPGQYLNELASLVKTDISWVKDVKIDMAADVDADTTAARLKLTLNDVYISTVEEFIDQSDMEAILGIDVLSDSYIKTDLSSALSGVSMSSAASTMSAEDMEKYYGLLEKYLDMALNSVEDITESTGTFEASGVSENCKVFTANLSERDIMIMEKKLLSTLLEDSDVKNFLVNEYYPAMLGEYSKYITPEEYYEQMKSSYESVISSLDQQIDNASDDNALTVVDYVSRGMIIGREIKVYSGGKLLHVLSFGNTSDGGRFGTELTFDDITYLSGSGTCSGSVINGELQISDGDVSLGTVKFSDFDYTSNKGSFEIGLTSAAWRMITGDYETAMFLSTGTLKIEFSDDRMIVDAMLGSNPVVKLTLSKNGKEDLSIDGSKEKKDLESWRETIDSDELFDRLKKAGVPDQYSEIIKYYISSITSSNPYYNNYYYY